MPDGGQRRSAELETLHCLLLAAAAILGPGSTGAQTVVAVNGLSFGAFVAGGGGSVTVSPNGAIASTGVVMVPQGGSSAAAQFTVTGTASAAYTITLPANGVVTLSDGSHTMAVNNFTSSPSGSGSLSGGGTQFLFVGASLTVSNSQSSGNYSGVFDVTVNYQ